MTKKEELIKKYERLCRHYPSNPAYRAMLDYLQEDMELYDNKMHAYALEYLEKDY